MKKVTSREDLAEPEILSREELKKIMEKELDFKYGAVSVKLKGRFRPIRAIRNFFLDLYCPY